MSKSNSLRIFLDAAMLALLPLALAFRITGETVHEFIGLSTLALFCFHNFLNLRWYGGIFKGKYGIQRAANTFLNATLAATAISMFFSGLLISKYSPVFFDNHMEMLLRQIHSICAYWTLMLAAVHMGFRFGKMRLMCGIFKLKQHRILTVSAAFFLAFGIWSWADRGFFGKLFLGYSFDFWDCESSGFLFVAQNCAIIWIVAFAAHLIWNIKIRHNIYKTKDKI